MLRWTNVSLSDALHLDAINYFLFNYPHLINCFLHPEKPGLRSPSKVIIKKIRGLSHSEQLLVRMGMDIWNGSGQVNLLLAYEVLSSDLIERFCESLDLIRGN